ncbi:MAG: hypothetical protein KBS84_02560 [Treponema sp.]|nr:hypothetical protein [Candidatus Treponema scatequi]
MINREPLMSEHAKKVLRWRESFLLLEENRFFEIMRMYLGEIKTPYNKQKLIESLSAFFRKRENLVAVKSFLTKEEIEIICAIVFIPDATESKLINFFENSFTYSFLYETLRNLEERLIIFSSKTEYNEECIELAPIFDEAFYDLINIKNLLPEIEYTEKESEISVITPEFISCFTSYVIENPNIAKQDGTLKKHTLETASLIFGLQKNRLSVLYSSFLNLSILKESGKGVEIDWSKLYQFVNQSFIEQIVYIAVSSTGHFSRDSLRVQAQTLIDTFVNLGDIAFTRDLFLRTGFLVAARPRDVEVSKGIGAGRFAKMISESRARIAGVSNVDAAGFATAGGLDRVFDVALALGLIYECGTSENGSPVYKRGLDFNKSKSESQTASENSTSLRGMINIEAGMELNLMPGFAVKDFIELTKFISLKRVDTVCSFSISRQSIMRGFDSGLTSEKIISLLKERASYEIPETLLVQIEEWSASYSMASFYKGFVLKLEGKAAMVAEHNSILAPHIHTVIAPGIFLLDVKDDAEAMELIKASGLDFIGKIKTAKTENESLEFMKLNLYGKKIDDNSGLDKPDEIIETESSEEIEKNLYAELDKLSLDAEQRDSLELRIDHKVIVNPSQLNTNVIRLERISADGMDFAGKVYVVEQAIKCEENIELQFGQNGLIVFGLPVALTKRRDETYVEMNLIPENVIREYEIGKASSVKRIRKNIYRDR